jgi:hypothetical protein
MPVTTRQMKRMEPILSAPPLAGMEEMMQQALDIVRMATKNGGRVSTEQLKEFKICKKSLTRFSEISNMETHFLLHFIINEQLIKLMDETYLIAA